MIEEGYVEWVITMVDDDNAAAKARLELINLRERLEEAEEIIATLAHATYPEEINTAIGEAKDYIKCTS